MRTHYDDVTATFTLSSGRTLTLPVAGELALVPLGEVGGGDKIILRDLTVVDVRGGVYFGDEEDPHSDPPDGDWTGKVTLEGIDGTRRRLPYQTLVWRVRGRL